MVEKNDNRTLKSYTWGHLGRYPGLMIKPNSLPAWIQLDYSSQSLLEPGEAMCLSPPVEYDMTRTNVW